MAAAAECRAVGIGMLCGGHGNFSMYVDAWVIPPAMIDTGIYAPIISLMPFISHSVVALTVAQAVVSQLNHGKLGLLAHKQTTQIFSHIIELQTVYLLLCLPGT